MSDTQSERQPNANGLSAEAIPGHSITGRVIVELDANGKLWMEFYTNGQRTRTLLDRGNEWWNVVDELSNQRRHAITQAERQMAKLDENARKRHRQVWTQAAERQGIGFARDVIKGEVPVGYGKYFAEEKTSAKKVKDVAPAIDLIDLL